MATWEDVHRIALTLPAVSEEPLHDERSWRVRGKLFVWSRPLRKTDLAALGDSAPPPGPILGAKVADESVKQALIESAPEIYFTTPHFDGYAAILVLLDRIAVDELAELIVEAWLLRAPKHEAARYEAEHGLQPR